MKDERKQDLSGPDEEALEQHVHEMLDITVPDSIEIPEAPIIAEPEPANPTKITISEPEIPSAPQLDTKKSAKKSVAISVAHHEDEPEPIDLAPAAPDLELAAVIEQANKQLAEQQATTAPPVLAEPPKPKATDKKVVITLLDDAPKEDTETLKVTDPEEPVLPILAEEDATSEGPTIAEAIEAAEAESPLETILESTETNQAVADIISTESDELLAMKDGQVDEVIPKTQRANKQRSNPFTILFRSSGARWITALLVFTGLVAAGLTPTSRYAALNTVGVRSSASIVVLDQSTRQPLKNVKVTLAGQTAQTDNTGKVQFKELRLGPTELVIEKRAFAAIHRAETVGWGSNPLADVTLYPVGIQYTFTIKDGLSGKPIGSAEAVLGDANANADGKGEIKLTLDQATDQNGKVQIKAQGYRDETIEVSPATKQNTTVNLTPAHKIAFISKRSGKYDLYKIDADGKNEQLVLAGTGSEQATMIVAPNPTENVVVLVSTRDNKRDADNYLTSSLTFVNLTDGTTKTVIQAQQIHAVDWVGTRFIYVQTVSGVSAEDPQRNKLMSFDYVSGDNRQLASSNYFNDVLSAGGKIYYAPSSAFLNGVNKDLFSVHADGSSKQSVLGQEVWNMYRTSYDHLTLAVQQDWYDYQFGSSAPTKLSGQPASNTSRVYTDSPDGKHSIWLDTRDGKGALILYDQATKGEKALNIQSGIKGPVRWISNNALVFRLVTSKESADYVVSIDGGEPRKLTDVTDTKGIDRWYYY